MAVVRITRYSVDPADTEELLTRRAALISAVRAAFPGLTEARLARLDETRWVDIWSWDSAERAQAALAGAPTLPEAQAAFAFVKDATQEQAEIVDER